MIVIWHRVGEDGSIVAQRGIERLPDPLHALLFQTYFPVLVVDASKEPGIEAHFGEETRIGVRVTKRIDVPANARSSVIAELLRDPLVAHEHIVHHVVVMGAGLVMHGPAGVDELKSAFFHKLARLILAFLSLMVPPHGEKLDLDLGEALLRVGNQLLNVGVNDVLYIRGLDVLFRAREVLIRRFEPADIVVTVRDAIHIEMLAALGEFFLKRIIPFIGVAVVEVFVIRGIG